MRKEQSRALAALLFLSLQSFAVHAFQSSASNPEQRPEPIDFKPFELTAPGGEKIPAEMGRLKVPENRSKPSSNKIELAVVRLKSRSENPGPPVFYLAGGPGGSAINESRLFSALFEGLREDHDIVLMDQRGTGRSTPVVAWSSPVSLPPDAFLSRDKMIGYYRTAGGQALESFNERGIDLSGYNSVESADDINELRAALGEEKVSLIGFSYGTHLALATIRRHAKHLDSVVLVGTEGPNHTLKLPSTYDGQLHKLAYLASRDPSVGAKVPDMVSLLRKILARLEEKPITVGVQDRRTKQKVDVLVGKFGLQLIVRMDIGDGNDFPEFPALFYTIDKGDYSILRKYVEKRYNQFSRGISGMSTMMDQYSGATAERISRIKKETETSVLGNVMNFPDMDSRDLWGNPDLGDEYRSPIFTNTRTLFVSGTLDSNTPPFQAEEVRQGFSNAAHIIVEYAGHEDMLGNKDVQAAILDFFKGRDVSAVRVSLGKPLFKPVP